MNSLINEMYDDISQKIFSLDRFYIPLHGINYPDNENPMNLFKR